PLNTIVSLVESEDYILNPEFQRRHRWDATRKSKLIESFIMNVPIPPIFLYEFEYSKYEVMDGLQRLTAISQFYKDEFILQDLGEWKELNPLNTIVSLVESEDYILNPEFQRRHRWDATRKSK
ncbi:DUF262 domain-containing protein, partial [Staphylococcus aureus]|uniref:DUF262 domain-containing protein n=1 Tax=Staphylococcus aureus TaxID=1280 RepID=UPI000F411D77